VVLDVSSSAQDITTAICQDMQTPLPEVCVWERWDFKY
jgi:hypothetical protein